MEGPVHDVAIIGGGAAGLSSALVLGRARRRVVVIDAEPARCETPARLQGYLSREGTPPSDFLRIARAEVARYGVRFVEGRVIDATTGFVLRLAGGGLVRSRQLLLATGAAVELPDIPGARERWGRDVLHCPYCRGWEVRDRPLGVLATGSDSIAYAHLVRQWSDDVVLFADGHPIAEPERATLAAREIAVVDGHVERLTVVPDERLAAVRLGVDGHVERFFVADDRLHAVRLADGRTFPRTAVFIQPELRAHPEQLGAALGCETHAGGLLRTDGEGRTSVTGVWAAGKAARPCAQAITAASEGAAVGIAINTDFVSQAVDGASPRSRPTPTT
jgi:thioredoxin reductase